jgi:hypothetical protein
MDLSFWMDNADLFFTLADRDLDLHPQESDQSLFDFMAAISCDERFASLIDEIVVDGRKLIGLSPVGQLFHETFRYRFEQQRKQLLPPDSGLLPNKKSIKYEDDNPDKQPGLRQHLERLLDAPYVIRMYTFYYNKDLPVRNYFRRSSKGGTSHLEGAYTDGKATTKFDMEITARTSAECDAAIVDLSEKYL